MLQNKLTIILPVYNGEDTIQKTLDSVKNQKNKDFNFVVFDNNSSDDTLKLLEDFKLDNFIIQKRKKTVSMADNWNCMIEFPETEYVCMIHGDDYYEPNFVDDVYHSMNSNFDLIVYNRNIVTHDADIINTISYNKVTKLSLLERFPGIAYVWKKNKILTKFNPSFFPIFDYLWFYQNLPNCKTIDYVNKALINITVGDHQITNQIKWEKGILKTLLYVIFSINFKNSISEKAVAVSHLTSVLKNHIIKSIKTKIEKK